MLRHPRPGYRLLAALLFLLAVPVRADYKAAYEEGLQASEKGDWTTVERRMREAIAEEPQESRRIRVYGMRFVPYLPHYYLGLARFEQGNCRGALEAWRTSESQGVVQATDEYGRLEENRSTCQRRLAEQSPARSAAPATRPSPELARARVAATAAVNQAAEVGSRVAALRRDPLLGELWGREVELGERERQALEQLAGARTKAESDRLEDVQEATRLANQARQTLEAIEGRARQRGDELRQARERADEQQRLESQRQAERTRLRQRLDELETRGRRLLGTAAGQRASIPELSTARADLEALLRETRDLGLETPTARLEGLRGGLESAVAALEQALAKAPPIVPETEPPPRPTQPEEPSAAPAPSSGGPPTVLRNAAQAFFDGDYSRTVDLLESARIDDRRAQVQAHLFLAAARWALYVKGDEHNAGLRQSARRDVEACRRLEPGFSPDPETFSPGFRAFFAENP
jgi:hypothetical protein